MELKEFDKISYLTNGYDEQKLSLVFIHGFPDNLYVWSHLIDLLKESYNILSLGLPGTYKHWDVGIKDFMLEELSLKFFKIIQMELGPNPKTVISHDMGGGYAHKLASHLGEETKIVCINTLAGELMIKREKYFSQMLKSSYMLFFQLPLEKMSFVKKNWKKFVITAHQKGKSKTHFPKEYNENIINGFLAYRAMFRAIPSFIFHHKYQNQTLFIWGEKDPFILQPTHSELDKYYFDWKLKELNCGHWPMLDENKKCAEWIANFVGESHV